MKSILKIEHTNGLWLKPLEWAAVLCITIAVLCHDRRAVARVAAVACAASAN